MNVICNLSRVLRALAFSLLLAAVLPCFAATQNTSKSKKDQKPPGAIAARPLHPGRHAQCPR